MPEHEDSQEQRRDGARRSINDIAQRLKDMQAELEARQPVHPDSEHEDEPRQPPAA